MHYFIDGYNLLFRIMQAKDDLQSCREQLIVDLQQKLDALNLDVSIVFDSAFQAGDRSRSHYQNLEILFTAEGETADEFILHELSQSRHPRQETLITSDKKLAWHARHYHAHTESVEAFLNRLNKSQKSQLRKQIKTKSSAAIPIKESHPIPTSPPAKPQPPESELEYYEQTFQERFQELLKKEKKRIAPSPPASTKKKKKSLLLNDPFERTEDKALSDMERWLKIFEQRAKE